jgi:hypothetical protein
MTKKVYLRVITTDLRDLGYAKFAPHFIAIVQPSERDFITMSVSSISTSWFFSDAGPRFAGYQRWIDATARRKEH